jgi:hypothetical protein
MKQLWMSHLLQKWKYSYYYNIEIILFCNKISKKWLTK